MYFFLHFTDVLISIVTKSFICSAQAVQNLGMAVVSILAGMIVDQLGYLMLEMFFLGWLWSTSFSIL